MILVCQVPILDKCRSLMASGAGLLLDCGGFAVGQDDRVGRRQHVVSRRTDVSPERLLGWLDRFAGSHGELATAAAGDVVVLTAADGTVARLAAPFPPLPPAAAGGDLLAAVVAHARVDRRVGVLLVRLGGCAAGVFEGSRLVVSKVGTRPVHGRSAAGGWSQQRFARRRDGQVRRAWAAAADIAAQVLLPAVAGLDAVVAGGDRRSVEAVLSDPRLARVARLVGPALLDVPDPRLAVLRSTPAQFRAVHVEVVDAPPPHRSGHVADGSPGRDLSGRDLSGRSAG